MWWQYVLVPLAFFFAPAADAQDIEDQAAALKLITETARDICDNVELDGASAKIEAEGEVEAGLSSLLKRLADLGISASVSGEVAEYSNLKQQDLAKLVINNPGLLDKSKCRLAVLKSLKNDLLPGNTAKAAAVQPRETTTASGENQQSVDLLATAIRSIKGGDCPSEIFSPLLTGECLRYLQHMTELFNQYGSIENIKFLGMQDSQYGFVETYQVNFESGIMTWLVDVGRDGKLATFWSPG